MFIKLSSKQFFSTLKKADIAKPTDRIVTNFLSKTVRFQPVTYHPTFMDCPENLQKHQMLNSLPSYDFLLALSSQSVILLNRLLQQVSMQAAEFTSFSY